MADDFPGLEGIVAPGAKELRLVASELTQPNGITGAPDGKLLYICDINAKKTYSFDIAGDGMTLDEAGNVYFTNQLGVCVFDSVGKRLDVIPTRGKWAAHASFGGVDRKTLFNTASESLCAIKMNLRGGKTAK